MSDCDHLNHPENWLGDCGDTDAIVAGLTDARLVARHAVRCAVAVTLGLIGMDASSIDYGPVDAAVDSFFDEAAR